MSSQGDVRMRRYLRAALALIAACALSIGSAACRDADPRIVLGPLPERPVIIDHEDAGPDVPDGSVLCKRDEDCDDGVECTQDFCAEAGYCQRTGLASRCSDDSFCNGLELCDARVGCVPGKAPDCNDQNACTLDACDEALKACTRASRDFDHDGEVDVHCPGGTDCDDFDETKGARASEVCGDVVDNDCDDLVDENECGSAGSDTCADALDVSAGGVFLAPLVGTVSDYVLSCESRASRDVVFTFTLARARDVKLVARGMLADGSEEIAALALQRSCGQLADEIECRRSFPAELRARALPAGTYFVVASSFGARAIALDVIFDTASAAPTNTTCAKARDVGDGGRFEGSFVDVRDRVSNACGVAGQPDLFYTFTLAEKRDVEIVAVSEEGAPLTFSVQRGCDANAEALRCESKAPARGLLHELPKGTYTIVLAGPSTREVSYALEVAILPPTAAPKGDACDNPLKVELNEKQRITLGDKQDLLATSCERPGPDAVLSLRLGRAMDLDVKLDGGDSLAYFALQSECSEPASDLVCRGATPLETRVRNLAAGDYFVVVNGPNASAVTLEIKSLPRSRPVEVGPNGSCATAFEVPAVGGLFHGDTTFAGDEYQAQCGGRARSNDAVFKLVLEAHKRVVARIDSSFDSVLYRFEDERDVDEACTEVDPDACDDDSGEGAQAELDESLDAGTHYYVVDGFKTGNQGAYLLSFEVSDE